MKKDKLFDVIVYRFLLSIPLSCVANFVYGFMLFIAIFTWDSSLKSHNYKILVLVTFSIAIMPFIIFNMVRYLAIKSRHIKYGLIALIISSLPEYLFIIIWILFDHIN